MSENRDIQNQEISEDLVQKIISKSNDKNENHANVGHSGNSKVDVNVNVQIDTKALAYALLCSSLARKEISNDDFDHAISKLEELLNKQPKKESEPEIQRPFARRQMFRNF
ncbi:hypothetical protein [Bacillus sp. EB01]|uniref:hypothetical protein n=1 Tax=Bacillus sp. EB01 TaxID=1347086 RepID=UPI000693C8E1|nr:hypothetical protein [Bacillus sp. EB01]